MKNRGCPVTCHVEKASSILLFGNDSERVREGERERERNRERERKKQRERETEREKQR